MQNHLGKTAENRNEQVSKVLTPERQLQLLELLEERFRKRAGWHKKGLEWSTIAAKLRDNPDKLWTLNEMERTGGEPDLVYHNKQTDRYLFGDCSKESPSGRRNVCYDSAGQKKAEQRGEKPAGNAVDMAHAMGGKLTDVSYYDFLQSLDHLDSERISGSWIAREAITENTHVPCRSRIAGILLHILRGLVIRDIVEDSYALRACHHPAATLAMMRKRASSLHDSSTGFRIVVFI